MRILDVLSLAIKGVLAYAGIWFLLAVLTSG
jgi:hypothetical protein